MRAVSARFLEAVRNSHTMITEADLLLGGQIVLADVAVAGGKVTLDRTASTLARVSLTIAEPQRLPTSPSSMFTPYGYELAVRRGIRWPTGDPDLFPLGIFPIQSSSVKGRTLSTSIVAFDRSQKIRDNRFENTYQVASGVNYATAIMELLEDRAPGGEYAFCSTPYETPLLTFAAWTDDPWEMAQRMARNIGCELYIDALGRRVLRDEPNLAAATPVWTVDAGPGGVLIDIDIELDRRYVYNKIVATGENASLTTVPSGEAIDDDPASPSYYYGPFGMKPGGFASPFLKTAEQCAAAALGRLRSKSGLAAAVSFQHLPNPALEAGDLLLGVHPGTGLNSSHIADVLEIGLGPRDPMSAVSRARQEAA